jgi:hypothetical protein
LFDLAIGLNNLPLKTGGENLGLEQYKQGRDGSNSRIIIAA